MNILKFGAIDIGSNAVRLLLMDAIDYINEVKFRKASLVRMPIRLGEDVFTGKAIPQKKIDQLLHAMLAFKHLMLTCNTLAYKAYATAALREASNKTEVIKTLEEFSGINIEIIDGKREAEIIYLNQIKKILDNKKKYLYVDVGGGSTEITFFSGNKVSAGDSFKIGTVRLLHKMVKKEEILRMEKRIKSICSSHNDIEIIGSGGNINKLIKISKKKQKSMNYDELEERLDYISKYSYEDRIKKLGMKPDRADVIIPAGGIFKDIMHWGKINKIHVPKIGLSDGTIRQVYNQYTQEKQD